MHPLAHHFLTMAHNNAWANYRLIQACLQLSQDEFVAPRTSFFPSIKATLNHNLTVDWYYVDALERSLQGREAHANPGAFFDPEEPFERCADLWVEQRAVDERLITACRALPDDLAVGIRIPRRAGVVTEPIPRFFAHLFQHQIHHRGQVHAMLSGTRIAPPQLDEFFCLGDGKTGDFALRQPDFAALGWSEEMIWGPDATRAR
jgi:uncharacterized damage-inducible protein DinB